MEQPSSIKQRSVDDYVGLSRSLAVNHLKTEVKKSETKTDVLQEQGAIKTTAGRKLHLLKQFMMERLWDWLKFYIINRFGERHDFQTYSDGIKGIYRLDADETIKIGILSDWATFTEESCALAKRMNDIHDPQFTIHIGDTYYVGEPKEIAANFLGENSPWIRGSKGSFALLGNHEMYARGISYYRDLLRTLGMRKADGSYQGQQTSFFCLENDHWRILGLDTGYNSIGKIPLLELIPFLAPNCRFEEALMHWLDKDVKLHPNDKRGIVVLTHHQYLTAFKGEGEFTQPAKQLAKLLGTDKPILWLFGHEHKFAMYHKAQINGGVAAYCRCIGHGGMPIEFNRAFKLDNGKNGFSKLAVVDNRRKQGSPFGYNGYALLSLQGNRLNIDYYDHHEQIVGEEWLSSNGTIKGHVNYVIPSLQSSYFSSGMEW
ncbi:metallophosphoesterase family protein [Flavisolibacter nicotianae]|uniref:metallophosphoesterase family protein n=1 Tax=Flavisolibacter nicotianae TaxID=2364882 RepID=UPI000EB51720|nr:metallophosphoesterase [Flavisolibacter nicotianae]